MYALHLSLGPDQVPERVDLSPARLRKLARIEIVNGADGASVVAYLDQRFLSRVHVGSRDDDGFDDRLSAVVDEMYAAICERMAANSTRSGGAR
jgi:hypothetical protein